MTETADYRFEVTGITPIGLEVRFLRGTASFALEKAEELISIGTRKVVITDLLDGTQYPPGRFQKLFAQKNALGR